ncbi:MAG: substrate-binding domain-containing protein, partial [Lachnospiraceae bacterium]|nr:substrate-binding domain-containing protein [Lachnospiraceae bacterium]
AAIVCENNTLAVGAARVLKESGIDVPKEIVFLTFDIYPYTDILDPRPYVVDINVYDMGSQVGELIIKKINNPALMIQSYTTLPEIG